MIGHFFSLALRFVGTLILTRIFAPEAFGILAVVMSVQVVVTLLTDIGLRQAIIQSRNGDKQEFLNTAFSLQILRGIFIWAMNCVCAAGLWIAIAHELLPAHSVYADPQVPIYLAVASFSAVLLGLQSMKAITAGRNLQLERLFIVEIIAQLASLIFVILLGWATRSLWAYIYAMLFSAAITAVLSHCILKGSSDRLGWNREASRELFRFGRWTFLSSMLSAFAANGDRLLLGGWLNAQMLGFYSVAYSLASVPDGLAGRIFGAVSFPVLSEAVRLQPQRVPEIYFRMRWITDAALLLIAGFLFSSGSAIVNLLYDPRYVSSGWMLEYLSFGLIFARYGLSQNAYLALGRPEYVTILSVTKLISLFSLVTVLFYAFGVQGAVLGVAFHMLPTSICTLYLNRKHHLNNLRLELGVLVSWIFGWLAGLGFSKVVLVCC
ncbi:oligosaccharide flippase family protein [Bradyrhizobium sp. SRL28]|uniref:oligosaccharide flippase family protein n=1 Tax=Bradyrhizobium sp. SRL28 TaxID=2836178 RepID=UPI001BDE8BDB|nr:oligosaccharide flippase family protein [Bradyrhizobium sp. SRL28]MBT1515634.1 oligosaccharide flippase family protein [Bradyrhizobium sp. SRL28]